MDAEAVLSLSAVAVVGNTIGVGASEAVSDKDNTASASKASTARGAGAIAPVHYGVRDRSELMGRAAGPVYNFKGSSRRESTAAAGKLAASAVGDRMIDIQKQLDGAELPADQRAKLKAEIETIGKKVDGVVKAVD